MAHRATYADVFRSREYRALFTAQTLSAAGDMLARVAVAILIFDATQSALLSAASFAVSYAPSIIGGPFLATLADHLPWRTTLVGCDIARCFLIASIAIPGMPLYLVLFILFLSSLVSAPFDAARVAILPALLQGELYVLGVTAGTMVYQLSQIAGFLIGGIIVAVLSPVGALLIDAGTFALSGLLLAMFLKRRDAPTHPSQRRSLVADTLTGMRMLAHTPVLRSIVLLTWVASAFGFAHEGLAAPLAAQLGGGDIAVGTLLAASPLGVVCGAIVLSKLPSQQRLNSVPYFALAGCAVLIPVAFISWIPGVIVVYFLSGIGMAFIVPLNATFNQIIPENMRGRAAGATIAGLMAGQGLGILFAGWGAEQISSTSVVAITGTLGTLAVALLTLRWPSVRELTTPLPSPADARDSYSLAQQDGRMGG